MNCIEINYNLTMLLFINLTSVNALYTYIYCKYGRNRSISTRRPIAPLYDCPESNCPSIEFDYM